jgi:hypothetical protein
MRLRLSTIIVLVIFAGTPLAQTPAVDQASYSATGEIGIMTRRVVLWDTTDRFVEMQFVARCSSSRAPTINMKFFSRSFIPLYARDADHALSIVADRRSSDLALLTYQTLTEKEGPVRDVYALPGPHNLTQVIPTPPSAQIKKANSVAPLIVEAMSTLSLTLDFVNKIANAKRLEIDIGNTSAVLDQDQMAVLREFAASVNLPDQNAPIADAETTDQFSDLPHLDLTTASLKETTDWLKRAVAISGQIIEPLGTRMKFEIIETDGCTLTARLGGRTKFRPFQFVSYSPDLETIANLRDLNPDLIRLEERSTFVHIMIIAMNKPKAIVIRNREGGTGRIYDEHGSTVTSFLLRKDESVGPIRDALIHAIRLCQSKE